MLFGQLQHHRGQQEDGDEVGDGHKAVEGVADAPDQTQVRGGAHNGDQRIGNVERQQDLASQQELCATGAVQTPIEIRDAKKDPLVEAILKAQKK